MDDSGDLGEGETVESEEEVNDDGWVVYRGGKLKNRNATHICVHESVTALPENAFFQFTSLVSIHIPASVVSIGSHCFQDCFALRDIKILLCALRWPWGIPKLYIIKRALSPDGINQ
mmetsp:Transcript_24821/g.68740  ORF Transcript_24821/g.68740 Transcript_24821/m.68740 type:complete len:117 (+) Transcript_24821:1008-1358(+)